MFLGKVNIRRVGGDEFVIFVPNADKERIKSLSQELCFQVKRKYGDSKKEADLSCSVGLAYYKEDGTDYTSLFTKADVAMYYSKLQGGNRLTTYKEIIDVI
jgi:diguanylate cyclase (GGDEF)-like protein